MPPGADVMDNRTEIWMPIGLNPGNRQNRGSHFLYLVGRLKDGVTPQAAQSELTQLIQTWGERTGQKNHVFAPLPKTAEERKTNFGHILQMNAGAGADRRRRQPRDLGAAGRGGIRAADRVREPREPAARARRDAASRVRGAHRAWRRTRPAAAAVHDRRRAAVDHRRRARPAARARRRAGADSRLSDQPAAHRGGRRRSGRVALHVRRLDRDGPGVRSRAVDAHAREGPGARAEGRRRAGAPPARRAITSAAAS